MVQNPAPPDRAAFPRNTHAHTRAHVCALGCVLCVGLPAFVLQDQDRARRHRVTHYAHAGGETAPAAGKVVTVRARTRGAPC